MSNQEVAFLTCLKEIEICYTTLPKSTRLRVERWVEKLVIVGENILWKKHRNMYARLLLSMILSKNLTDPFDVNPSEGPLPPFPAYLRSKLKNISGPHESNFWRNIYHRLPLNEEPNSGNNLNSNSNLLMDSTWRFDTGKNEIDSLRQLIQEQTRRIEILEDQITNERLKHESEIIRFMEHHRGEINSLRRKNPTEIDHKHHISTNSNFGSSLRSQSSRNSHSHSLSHSQSQSLYSFDSSSQNKPRSNLRRSFETERISNSPLPPSPLRSSHRKSSPLHSFENLFSDTAINTNTYNSNTYRSSNINYDDNNETHKFDSIEKTHQFLEDEQKQDITPYFQTSSFNQDSSRTHNTTNFNNNFNNEYHDNQSDNENLDDLYTPTTTATTATTMRAFNPTSFPLPLPSLSPHHSFSSTPIQNTNQTNLEEINNSQDKLNKDLKLYDVPEEESEFLNYLENFQSELRSCQYKR